MIIDTLGGCRKKHSKPETSQVLSSYTTGNPDAVHTVIDMGWIGPGVGIKNWSTTTNSDGNVIVVTN